MQSERRWWSRWDEIRTTSQAEADELEEKIGGIKSVSLANSQ